MSEAQWAEHMVRRWRRAWSGFYLMLTAIGWLLSSVPISTAGDGSGATGWHWPMVVGGLLAFVGQRVRRPLIELWGAIGALFTLAVYAYVAGAAAWLAPPGAWKFALGFALLVTMPGLVLALRTWDVWTYPRERRS